MSRRLLVALALPLALAFAPSTSEAQSQVRGERRIICRGAAIPTGWLLVDDLRDRTMCEGSNPAVLRLYNVWAIERYDNRPIGTVIEVCAAAVTPDGWELVDVYRSKELCGHPGDAFIVNVKRIRRVR